MLFSNSPVKKVVEKLNPFSQKNKVSRLKFERKSDYRTFLKFIKDNTKEIYIKEFQTFWKVYPRKVGKKGAYKSFRKFDEKHYQKILYGAQRFAEQNLSTEEKYIPHATTWLNQERWMDYFETDESGWITGIKKQSKINNLAG